MTNTTQQAQNVDVKALQARLDALEAQNATLTAKLTSKQVITPKVSTKGAVSVYGVNTRFPVTLYAEQWERLLMQENVRKILDFIATNPKGQDEKGEPISLTRR